MAYSRSKLVRRLVAVTAWCLIASALVWNNLRSAFGGMLVPTPVQFHVREDSYLYQYGWPSCYLERWVTIVTSWQTGQQLDILVKSTFRIGALVFNATVALIILGSTTLVLKIWLRKTRLTQLALKTVMTMIAVIAILMTLYKARDDLNAMMPYRPLIGNVWMIPMYLKIPLSIAIGCVVFIAVSSAVSVFGRLLNVWRQGR